jgi:antitoxin CcdA
MRIHFIGSHFMSALAYPAGKRAVNLTLNEHLVTEAKRFTDNLSATVESLVMQFVQTKKIEQLSRQEMADQCARGWNEFADIHGSFADEYCTLYVKQTASPDQHGSI